MAAMLVDAYTGVLNTILFKLSKLLEDEYPKIKGVVRNQITFLRDELSSMKPMLEMLADVQELDPLTKEWRDNMRELAYDIEDYIDSFMVRVNHQDRDETPTGFKGFFRKLKKLKACHEIADEIRELKTCATEASNIVDLSSNSITSGIDARLLALNKEKNILVGIDQALEHIIDWSISKRDDKNLMENLMAELTVEHGFYWSIDDGNLKSLAVLDSVGLGEITSLATQVYCKLEDKFQCSAFVSASQNLCTETILRCILFQLAGIVDNTSDNEVLIVRIRHCLIHKRYFVVVDDVPDAEIWKAIKRALFHINRRGSRIVITTRNAAVGSCCTSDGGYVYQLQPLSLDDSKRFFFKRAFGSEDLPYPHLERVSDGILRNCGGLPPLAIIIMSSLLADQHEEDEWNRVLSTVNCASANNLDVKRMLTKILSLCYFDLPRHLRTCLLYLSIFPKDDEINKQRLVNRWIAEGFIHEEQRHGKYEVGECYFNYLINRSFIEPVGVKYGQAKACRVHGIIHDFITCKASEENFFTSFRAAEHGPVSEYRARVRRLYVDNRNKNEAASRLTGQISVHVRSLTTYGKLTGTSLLAFPALRVLDLDDDPEISAEQLWQEFEKHQMTNIIENQLHLRYFRLGSSNICLDLPGGIGELQYLETLDIKGNYSIVDMPPTITRLHRLSRLYVTCYVRFPAGVIGNMQSLEELDEYGIRNYEQGKKALQEISQLTKLRTLKVKWDSDWWDSGNWPFCEAGKKSLRRYFQKEEGLQSYVQTLMSSCNLHHLYINNVGIVPAPYPLSLESCCPPTFCSLRKLHITYCFVCKLPNWIISLGNLRELKLYIYYIRPEDVEILGAIPSLVFLKLRTFYGSNGRIIVPGYKGFRCLKYFALVMMSCGTALEFEAGSMPELEHLKLRFCLHKVECLNGASDFGIQHLSTVKMVEVHIYGCLADHKEYDPEADMEDSNVRCVASLIKVSVRALPSRPSCSFELTRNYGRLEPFHGLIEALNENSGVSVESLVQEMIMSRAWSRVLNIMSRVNYLYW